MENKAKILLCDENGEERKRLIDFLTKSGFSQIDEANNGNSALDKILNGSYDLVILDLWLKMPFL